MAFTKLVSFRTNASSSLTFRAVHGLCILLETMPRYYELTALHMNMRRRWDFGQKEFRHLDAVKTMISFDVISAISC